MDRCSVNKSSFSFVYRRFHKRGGYDVENEEKVKLGLASNHWRDKERWVVRIRATSTYTDEHLSFSFFIVVRMKWGCAHGCSFFVFSFFLTSDTDAEILPQNRKREVNPRKVPEGRGSYMKNGTEVFLSSWPSAWRSGESWMGSWTFSWRPRKRTARLKLE